MDGKGWAKFLASIVLASLVLGAFSTPLGVFPSIGSLLDPAQACGPSRRPPAIPPGRSSPCRACSAP